MNNLPLELIDAFVLHLSHPLDLLQLRAVNSTFCRLVTPILFHTVSIQNSSKSAQHALNIFSTPQLAPYVHDVVLDSRRFQSFRLLSAFQLPCNDESEIADLEEALVEAFCSLSCLPNLTSLTLNFWPSFTSSAGSEVPDHPFWFTNRQISVLDAVYSAMKSFPSSSSGISSLTINNVALMHPPSYHFVSSLTNPTLAHLSISVVSNARLSAFSGSKALNHQVDALLPVPTTALRSLEIKSPHGLYHCPTSRLGSFTYPALEHLVLENIIFDQAHGANGWEHFILHHKNTLRRLELRGCASYLMAAPMRKWSSIWDCLREEMGSLEEVVMSGEEPCGYVMLAGGEGYVRFTASVPGVMEQDERHFRELCERVSS